MHFAEMHFYLGRNISCVCFQENSLRYLEVRNNEMSLSSCQLSQLEMYTPPPFSFNCYFSVVLALPLFCFLHIMIKRCISHISHAWNTSSHFTEILEARLHSLSAIKVIIRENEKNIFLQKAKFSQ